RYRRCARQAAGCVVCRWLLFAASAAVFVLRIYTERGWYVVAYSVGILVLNNTVHFVTPQVGPDAERLRGLSERRRHRFRLFHPRIGGRLGEYPCWRSSQKWLLVAIGMTFFGLFDIPVYTPILVVYFVFLMAFTLFKVFRERRRASGSRMWML
ncbi:unnamed protein product, partial [Ectocarpus sp. 12 AP-2014]